MNKLFLLGFLALSITAQAAVVSKVRLAIIIRAANSVNATIERETDLVRVRCNNQEERKRNINDTLASFSQRVTGINQQIDAVIVNRKPNLDALTAANQIVAAKKSLIKTLRDRINAFGRDSVLELSLKKEEAEKTTLMAAQIKERADRHAAFHAWEDKNEQGLILDRAHIKLSKTPPEALLPNEQEAINVEKSYNDNDTRLAISIQELMTRLSGISTELVAIQQGDNRSMADLIIERGQAELALQAAQNIRTQQIPIVAAFNRQIRQLQARVAVLTGFRPVAVNTDCVLILQTN